MKKLKRDIIVYFGMGFLPEGNAVACREQALADIAKDAGYTPVLIGISRDVSFGSYTKNNYDGIDNYSLKYAASLKEKLLDTYIIPKTLITIFEDVGIERIKCFIMQDYQLRPMKQLKKYCEKHGIAYVADIMDWFTPTSDYSLYKNIFKSIDTFFRMVFFYPFLKNKIYISHKFSEYFEAKRKSNFMVLPCTCKDNYNKSVYGRTSNRDNITMTFAGFPGKKFDKEKLDWIVRALYENKSNIELNIIGVDENSFISRDNNLAKCLTERIHFYGYMPRSKCLDVLKNSDFSVIARKVNKLTEYGFSSKICEAFAYGIPVIATDNCDNKVYIKDEETGFVCDANYGSLKKLLAEVEKTEKSLICKMHDNLSADNPLSVKKYVDKFSLFIEKLTI